MKDHKRLLFVCAALFIMLISKSATPQDRGQSGRQKGSKQNVQLRAKQELYLSKMDGKKRPYAVCVTDDSPGLKPLIVIMGPGVSDKVYEDGSMGKRMLAAATYAETAKDASKSCVVIRTTGRGPGSRCQNYGEVDVLEAIEDVCAKYPIDRDRISIHGNSMGGAAVYYLVSRFPDMFSCAVPTAGYCDYRLWEKPGGSTFHMAEWEEPSWQARSAVFLPENFEHTPMWIMHGEWDRAIKGNVPVEHSRQMNCVLSDMGFNVKYTEAPGEGHGFVYKEEIRQMFIPWMLEQKKIRNPLHVKFATYWLRHNKSYWVAVDQLGKYGKRGAIDATLEPQKNSIDVNTENVKVFTLGPIERDSAVSVTVNGKDLRAVDLSRAQTFHCKDGKTWKNETVDLSSEKRKGCSGPISDIFFDEVIRVKGTTGTDEEDFHINNVAGFARGRFLLTNGGLHRGGVAGENSVTLRGVEDGKLTEEDRKAKNLLLFGTDKTNSVLKSFEGKLPISFGDKSVTLYGKKYEGKKVSAFAIFPHPENPSRYVAVHGGVTPDAIVWGCYLNLLLLPDYLVYDGGKMLDWGFANNDWQLE
ncbi:prolyl oligopeptidase family serine peptidase [Candidatus Hydrogenedentota bacterium]